MKCFAPLFQGIYSILVLSLSTVTMQAASLTLADKGNARHVIVVAEGATPAETNAAEQLRKYLQQITGAEFRIVDESAAGASKARIWVGQSSRVKEMVPDVDWAALRYDGIVIKSKGDDLILAGGRPRGTLYAVYEFLEQALGCRWWTPTEHYIPSTSSLQIPPQDTVYTPPFDYREHQATSTSPGWVSQGSPPVTHLDEKIEFSTTLRENGTFQMQGEEWGGHVKIIGWVHTSFNWLSPDDYFEQHPEWYSDAENSNLPSTKDSKLPTSYTSQLCFTNPEVQEEMAKQVVERIRTNPSNYTRDSFGYIAVDENDNGNYCACSRCREMVEKEGSESGPIISLVNHVAAEVEKEYPNFLVETLAYRGSIKPPKTARPAHNVIIRMAPLQADFSRPHHSERNVSAPEVTEPAADYLRDWVQVAHQMFIWNYVTNFQYTMLPYPNWDALGADLRFFAENKVRGVFEQGDVYTNNVTDFAELRTWLLGKLMWNPQLDQSKLMDEFLAGYYGAAAPFLRKYLDLVQTKFLESSLRLSSYHRDYSFMDVAAMNEATHLLDKAAAAVKNDAILAERVRRQRIPLDLLWVYNYLPLKQQAMASGGEFSGPTDWAELAAKVDREARHFGVALWQEKYDGTGHWSEEYARIDERVNKRAPLPTKIAQLVPKGKEGENVINLHAADFTVLRLDTAMKHVDDPLASNGRAIEGVGSSFDWNTTYNLSYYGGEFFGEDKWRMFVVARIQLKDEARREGLAFQTGVYDNELAKTSGSGNVFHRKVEVAEMPMDGEYAIFEIGAPSSIRHGASFWFAGPGNAAVEAVYLDRVIFVRE